MTSTLTFKKALKYYSCVFGVICLLSQGVAFAAAPNMWDVLRRQFSLRHDVSQPEVQRQIKWIQHHPEYIRIFANHSRPYLYYVVAAIKKHNLPGEVALLPMIESTYNPFAYSSVGAAGLWQLMPETGSELGLSRDWWYDGRRDIKTSTDAALQYLSALHKRLNNNWTLAFAAYDAGAGKVFRSIRQGGQRASRVNFWRLALPRETKAYLPRLFALAEIIQNPRKYQIQLPNIPYEPYFQTVDTGGQIDLNRAAKLAGISYKELIALNPQFNRWATPPYAPHYLFIPVNKAAPFQKKLVAMPQNSKVRWKRHQVSRGENLARVAQKYHTTANLIKQLNQMQSDTIKPGQFILIPTRETAIAYNEVANDNKKVVRAPAHNEFKLTHIVQKSDSYASLAKHYHVEPQNIRFWNQLSAQMPLHPGQALVIWQPKNEPSQYTVKKGDSLSVIAKKHNTTLKQIAALNPNLKKNIILPGQVIKIA